MDFIDRRMEYDLTNSFAAHSNSCIESKEKVLIGVFRAFGLGGGSTTRAT